MLEKFLLYLKVASYSIAVIVTEILRNLRAARVRRQALWFGSSTGEDRSRNIVIVGGSFAGHHVAKLVATGLSPHSPYRVVVIEPNSHFNFTWVFPRFCVVKGHEHKAFVPYGGNLAGAPEGAVRWVRDRVAEVSKEDVTLQDSGEKIPYDFLVIATGSGVKEGLPSRVKSTEKWEAMKELQAMQQRIEAASEIVVVGGGAAGVEVATDAQSLYPHKHVTLIHSRAALMHRFGKGLQDAALQAMQKLGGDVILNERVVAEDAAAGTVTLQSGRVIKCDLFINCTGQKPSSEIVAALSPGSIAQSGHIKIKPNLRIADDSLPNVYVCGEVADTKTPNPNSRSAMRQASIVADNLLLEVRGKAPKYKYKNRWADGVILLTLGLHEAKTHLGDGKSELLFDTKEEDEALMSARCWIANGEKPYEDPYMEGRTDIEPVTERVQKEDVHKSIPQPENMFQSVLGLFVAVLTALPVAVGKQPPTAKTLNGTYVGRHIPEFSQDVFLGEGTRSAQHNGHACWVPWLDPAYGLPVAPLYERANVTVDEDCLNLNILRPAGYEGKKLPVVVYIYGGGWIGGFGAEQNTNTSYMLQSSVARNAPYIIVNINYRVGFLGFPGGYQAWSAGITNLGLKDQRIALRWVHENIAAFGGDTGKVTLWGQSAGSMSVAHQVLAYRGEGADKLFRGGIMVSGTPYFTNTLYPNSPGSLALYNETLYRTNCTDAENTLECLRKAPVEAVAAAGVTAPALAIWPMIDGDFISEPPTTQLQNGRFSRKIKLIIGANSDEGLAAAGGFAAAAETDADVANGLRLAFPGARQSVIDQVLEAYPVDGPSPPYALPPDFPFCEAMRKADLPCTAQYRRMAAILGDLVQAGARRNFAEQWTAKGGTAYSYRFDTDPTALPIQPLTENKLAPGFSTHSAEIAYFFELPSDYDMLKYNPTIVNVSSHRDLARGITAGLGSFIVAGDPNRFKVPYFPKWPAYSLDKPVNMVYNATEADNKLNVHIEADTWRQKGMSLWSRYPFELQYLSPFRP
ncbi:Lipase 2 [Paramyrothecium foliicola]|nr:Lipase 2 [Paramyrothecium foliicola]